MPLSRRLRFSLAGGGVLAAAFAAGPFLAAFVREKRVDHRIEGLQDKIDRHAAHWGLDPLFVASVVRHESSGDPRAVSSANARGLMQITPITLVEVRGLVQEATPLPSLLSDADIQAWEALRSEFQKKRMEIEKQGKSPASSDFRTLTKDEQSLLARVVRKHLDCPESKVWFRGQVVDETTGKPLAARLRIAEPSGGGLNGRVNYRTIELKADGKFDMLLPLSTQVEASVDKYDGWSSTGAGVTIERPATGIEDEGELAQEVARLEAGLSLPRNEWDDFVSGRRIELLPLSAMVKLDSRRVVLHYDAKDGRALSMFKYDFADRPKDKPMVSAKWDHGVMPWQSGVWLLPKPMTPPEIEERKKIKPPPKDLPDRLVKEIEAMGFNAGDLAPSVIVVADSESGVVPRVAFPRGVRELEAMHANLERHRQEKGEDDVYWEMFDACRVLGEKAAKDIKACLLRGDFPTRIRFIALGEGDGFRPVKPSEIRRGVNEPPVDRQLRTAPEMGYEKEWILTAQDLAEYGGPGGQDHWAYVRLGGKYGRMFPSARYAWYSEAEYPECIQAAAVAAASMSPEQTTQKALAERFNRQINAVVSPDGSRLSVGFTVYAQPDGSRNLRTPDHY